MQGPLLLLGFLLPKRGRESQGKLQLPLFLWVQGATRVQAQDPPPRRSRSRARSHSIPPPSRPRPAPCTFAQLHPPLAPKFFQEKPVSYAQICSNRKHMEEDVRLSFKPLVMINGRKMAIIPQDIINRNIEVWKNSIICYAFGQRTNPGDFTNFIAK